ncbi:MAG TPA: cytochrome c [Pyrinomonadaceae bacterium]
MPRPDDFTRRLLTAAAACLALAAVAGCTSRASKPAPVPGADATRVTYERNCAVCHGARGEGKQLGTLTIPSLRVGAPLTDPDERLFTQISEGGKGMPPFKHAFDDRRIQDLVRFIREEFQGKK